MQSIGWVLLRGAIVDVLLAILITAPARQVIPGSLFAVSAVVAVMIASRVLVAVLLIKEVDPARPPRRLVGVPIYSGLFGPDRDVWSRAIATADMMSFAGPRPYLSIVEEFARISARELFPAWMRKQYAELRRQADEEPAAIRGRDMDEIIRTDVVGYRDPVSNVSVGDLLRDPLRFERVRLMSQRLRSFVALGKDLSELAFVVLLVVAVPAIVGTLDDVTALQIGLAAVFVIALLLQAHLYVGSANLWFEAEEELWENLRPAERALVDQLQGRRLRTRWNFQPGFDSLLRRTLSTRLLWPLLFNAEWVLVLMGVPVVMTLAWPGGPHHVPLSYGYLALTALAIPFVLLFGLHYILGAIQNQRRVAIPVVSGVAAALLAAVLTAAFTGDTADLTEAARGAWVGLPTALAAAIVAAVQRPAQK